MTTTEPKMYSRVSLAQDSEYKLPNDCTATLIDTVPHPEGGEEGYILEVFNDQGESVDVVTVPKSAIAPAVTEEC